MPNLPTKLQSGQQFKPSVVRTVNNIIDYLKTQRLVSDNKTIRLNQLTSGIAISSIQNPIAKGGGSNASIDHPFKLNIVADEQGNQTLNITEARIIINGDQGTRVYFGYYKNQIGLPQNLKLPQQQGIWNVVGYIVFDENAPSNELNSQGWGAGCIYSNYDSTTAQFTLSSGFYHFIIGSIQAKKDQQGNLNYTVYRQLLFSSFNVDDGGIFRDFRGHWQKSTYPTDGSIVEDGIIADKFLINAGKLYVDGKLYQIAQFSKSGTPSEEQLFCLQFDVNGTVSKIEQTPTSDWVYFNQETATYLIPICLIYPSNISAVALLQFVFGSIFFNTKGKILLNQQDQLPSEYLQKKLKYEVKVESSLTEDQKKIFKSGTGYIVGVTRDSNSESEADNKVLNLSDQLFWNWTGISGYKKNEKQKLMNEENSLKWVKDQDDQKKPQHKVQGSLDALLEFKTQTQQVQGSTPQQKQQKLIVKLRYKPQYSVDLENGDTNLSTCFIIQDKSGKIDRITYTEKQSGDGVMAWDYTDKKPIVVNPPKDEQDQNKKYCLVGRQGQQLSWLQYSTANISLQGSIQNVFQIAVSEQQENQGQPVLRVKTQYDESVQQFHFLNLDEQGKLQTTTFNGTGIDSVMLWDNQTNTPFILDCPQNIEQGQLYVLTGDMQSGVHWVDFSDELGKVKCTETDQLGYLYEKVECLLDESILIQLNDVEQSQRVNISVNPDWFISSDDSIVIEYTDDGLLDLYGAGMVQVTEDDTPQFLSDKIVSSLEHLTIDIGSDQVGQYLDININPSAFISSDESIIIEETEDGYIDLYGAGMVQVNANDTPDYLDQKLVSQNRSLNIQPGQGNGESMNMNLQINPQYFISSDESIIIEETEQGGLDFKSNGKVKCSEQDTADFLNTKIQVDSSISGLITLDKQPNQILIKSALQGSGLLAIQNGVITPIEAPASGKYILACNEGVFSWMQYRDCENACKDGEQQ